MPRNGSGIYSKPSGTTAVPNTTVASAPYNTFCDDVAADLNAARPLVAGGTGSATVVGARENLGVQEFATWAIAATKVVPVGVDWLMVEDKMYQRNPGGNPEFTTAGGVPWSPAFRDDLNLPIVILATGQSNMLGGSGTTGGERRTINGNVYLWEQFPGGGQTTGWKRAGPGSSDWPFLTTGNALFYHFADMLERATGRTVLIVHQSVGGTPLVEFMPGGGGGIGGATGTIWNSLNASMVAARLVAIPGRSDGATMAGLGVTQADVMLWHQGEADADYRFGVDPKASNATQYLSRFRSMVEAYRNPASAGSGAASMLRNSAPVIAGELLVGGTSGGNATDSRNAELRKMRDEDQYFTCVPSDSLQSVDNLHFNGRDLVELARRYFHALGIFPKAHWIESGTSGGTDWIKYSNGRLVMRNAAVATVATATASGSGFTTGAQVWTFPVGAAIPVFIAAPDFVPSSSGATSRWITASARTATTITIVGHSWASIAGTLNVGGAAYGFWR